MSQIENLLDTQTPSVILYMEVDMNEFVDDEYIRLCTDCDHPVKEVGNYEESWTVCTGCNNIEQSTYEILLSEWDEV